MIGKGGGPGVGWCGKRCLQVIKGGTGGTTGVYFIVLSISSMLFLIIFRFFFIESFEEVRIL